MKRNEIWFHLYLAMTVLWTAVGVIEIDLGMYVYGIAHWLLGIASFILTLKFANRVMRSEQ